MAGKLLYLAEQSDRINSAELGVTRVFKDSSAIQKTRNEWWLAAFNNILIIPVSHPFLLRSHIVT